MASLIVVAVPAADRKKKKRRPALHPAICEAASYVAEPGVPALPTLSSYWERGKSLIGWLVPTVPGVPSSAQTYIKGSGGDTSIRMRASGLEHWEHRPF